MHAGIFIYISNACLCSNVLYNELHYSQVPRFIRDVHMYMCTRVHTLLNEIVTSDLQILSSSGCLVDMTVHGRTSPETNNCKSMYTMSTCPYKL